MNLSNQSSEYGDAKIPSVGNAFFHGSKARLESRSQSSLLSFLTRSARHKTLWPPGPSFFGASAPSAAWQRQLLLPHLSRENSSTI